MVLAFLLFLAAPESCPVRLQAAAAALQSEDLKAAASLLNAATESCKHSAAYLQLAGIQAQLSGNRAAAETAFKQAFKADPKRLSPPVLFTLAGYFANEGKDANVITCLTLIPETDADEAVYFNLGTAYSHLKHFDRARAAYFRAIDKEPEYADAYLHVGLDYASSDNLRFAIPWLDRAHAIAPDRAEITYALAEALLQLGYKKSVAALLSQASNAPLLSAAKGDLMLSEGQIAQAKSLYQAASGASAQIGLARVAIEEGHTELARHYLQGLRDNPAANEVLGLLEARETHWQTAIPLLREAPQRLEVVLALARAYAATDQVKLAIETLQIAAVRFPSAPPVHVQLAQLFRRSGRIGDSAREQEKFQELQSQERSDMKFEDPEVYVF